VEYACAKFETELATSEALYGSEHIDLRQNTAVSGYLENAALSFADSGAEMS
jgi:hypothetical protein